jgi:hypothetical protein
MRVLAHPAKTITVGIDISPPVQYCLNLPAECRPDKGLDIA